ncbi:MAG: SEC-C domain-containing protein [Marinospirillum sp.]|uniref:YchJ family protein n=1 Tax=Marinospirillum sp. TaxID=2183934 RepID=UPI001A0ED6E2|nr:YchJ family metal-binding protein [Marinospirillum sp.]MBE0506544.1 SEC-C domain-containing protein [Marinospirillum sp.]
MNNPAKPCPCGSGKNYQQCCQPLHQGEVARTPEQLMRSRYAAYVLQRADYLQDTWHPDTRPKTLNLTDNPDWQQLEVLSSSQQGTRGQVHFKAWYTTPRGLECLEEQSGFIKQKGRWYYHSGLIS